MNDESAARPIPWNKGRLIGQKPPLKLQEIWTLRTRLQLAHKTREPALFDLALDSKLRGCDLVALYMSDVAHGGHVLSRSTIVQRKTKQPIRFELTDQTRAAVAAWIAAAKLSGEAYLCPSRLAGSPHLSTRQYARIVKAWAVLIGIDPHEYGTHSLRRASIVMSATGVSERRRPAQRTLRIAALRRVSGADRALPAGLVSACPYAGHLGYPCQGPLLGRFGGAATMPAFTSLDFSVRSCTKLSRSGAMLG